MALEPKHDNILPVSTASHTNLLKREHFHRDAGPRKSVMFVVHRWAWISALINPRPTGVFL